MSHFLKRPKLSPIHKVLIAMYGTLFLLCAGLIAWQHYEKRQALYRETAVHLSNITALLAAQTDGDNIAMLVGKYRSPGLIIKNTQDAWYYVAQRSMRRVAEADHLSAPLRILAYDSTSGQVQTIVTSSDVPEFRAPFNDPTGLVTAMFPNAPSPQASGESESLSSAAPLIDRHGDLSGIVLAQVPKEEIEAEARVGLWRNILIMVAVFGIAALVLFRSAVKWIKQAEADRADLARRHEGITDSIAYAGKIQSALIPNADVFGELFEHFFVLNRPKDTVSGDFHWFHRASDDVCWVAAADCTGHGLPGAMMAAIGCSILNDIVQQHPDGDPATLLSLLSDRLTRTMHQSGQRKGAGDGMDIALCRIDRAQREVLFAGAYRPMYWLHGGELNILNGDRKPIGGNHHDAERKFSTHRIVYAPGDRIYLFSDGYADQFGGPERKKFMVARFNRMLLEHQQLNMQAQGQRFSELFTEWKGQEEQVDDVCIVGLQV
ncbi:MAG: SpoIIE family protein phosphatase [Flavobacteriales bacterium]|nr:SpoIIE family protein phosphatase [Flavobacteriales bacterium]MBK9196799.1 SpoIIE family protein phosphatase [Flavobacteriales bacterium]MBP6574770.1 SpoIIE family protein phosphatase [Flavobacteriales bacterium]